MKKIILDDYIVFNLIKDYNNFSLIKLEGKYNLSREYIRKILKTNGIILKKYNELNRKYNIISSYFDIIDTEEKAYFLGFLYADGNVSSKNNSITIKLALKDKEILNKFSNIIYGKSILYIKNNYVTLKFSDFNIKNKLIELGCVPNKTLKLKFPQQLNGFENHFIRGYFDGDGSIFRYKNDFGINIVSTNDFCNSINKIILKKFLINGVIRDDKKMIANGNNITKIIYYSGNRRVFKILNWLYQDATIYLERKYQKYQELKKWTVDVDSRLNSSNNHKNQYM